MQLTLLLWKSWKTTIRSKGWLIAQCVVTVLGWLTNGLSMYVSSKGLNVLSAAADNYTERPDCGVPAQIVFNNCTTFDDEEYCSIDRFRETPICNAAAKTFMTCNEQLRNKSLWNPPLPCNDNKTYADDFVLGQPKTLTVREWSESAIDLEFVSSTCKNNQTFTPTYTSSQYSEYNPKIHAKRPCGAREFRNVAMDAGKISKMHIKKTLVTPVHKSILDDYFPSLMKNSLISPFLFPTLFFLLQASVEVTQESNSMIKDYLLSMGMSRMFYFLHHFIFHFLKMWINALVLCLLIGLFFEASLGAYMLLLMTIACAGWVAIAITIGAMFKKPGITASAMLLYWCAEIILMAAVNFKRSNLFSVGLSLMSPLYTVVLALDGKRESDLRGMNIWFSEWKYAIPQGFLILLLLLNTIHYFFLAVITDFIRSSCESPMLLLRRAMMSKTAIEAEDSKRLVDENCEKSGEKSGNAADITLEEVHKIYSSGEHAVRGVNMSVRKGQVTALLGHNGAGKSTTFSMISGMTVPTWGRILVLGNESIAERQKLIGFCPQYNPIFPKLTVDEHLKFFANLKGVSDWRAIGQRVLTDLGMANVGYVRAALLSGGMKRKLCMAIAMAANPPIVLLDEPTAGLDPGARRDFERLLMSWKKDHAILLTTHYTDEAEMLADRIFIMARGKVFCSGSPQFLRKKFDSGYILSFAVSKEADTEKVSTEMMNVVKDFVPEVSVCKVRGKQFELKLSTDDSKRFVEMFRKIEEVGPSFGMQSYGLSLTKLEQVFLKVGELTGTQDRTEEVQTALKELIQENGNRSTGLSKLVQQMGHTMLKRLQFDLTHISSLLINLIFAFLVGYILIRYCSSNYTGKGAMEKLKAGKSVNLLHIDERYRIGIDSTLRDTKGIDQIAKQYGGYLDVVSASGDVLDWYKKESQSRPPIVGVLSKNDNEWTIYIHPRNQPYLPVLEAIAAQINNPDLKKIRFRTKDVEMDHENMKMMTDSQVARDYDKPWFVWFYAVVLIVASQFMVTRPLNFLIIERTSNFAHQERLTGFSRVFFLAASTLYDFLLFLLPYLFVITGSVVADASLTLHSIAEVILFPFVSFLSVELIILILYRVFSSGTKGDMAISTLLQGVGIIALIVAAFLRNYGGHTWAPTFLFCPVATVQMWIIELKTEDIIGKITGPIYIIVHFIALVAVFLLVEMWRYIKRRPIDLGQPGDDIVLQVNKLTKWYGKGQRMKIAVNDISFGVRAHECFGVLGINGAGKSSTFEMLTGNTTPNGGSAAVNGVNCESAPTIGYCPQADALIEHLTGRQSLVILAALHGYSDPNKVADIVITCVGMQEHADRASKKYSGGQRRKISVAASLLAQNSLIILDEPTAGIDPIARRDVWSVICALRENTNTAIVLTSHSMDEVEALVSNLIIMREGSIVVEGSPQMIKNQYGDHYNFNLVPESATDVTEITNQVHVVFPNATLYDSASLKNIKYKIPRHPTDVFSTLFEKAAGVAEQLKVAGFSFTQATLEDAFMLASTPVVQPQVVFEVPPQGAPGVTGSATGTATVTTTRSEAAPEAPPAPEPAGAEPATGTGTVTGTQTV